MAIRFACDRCGASYDPTKGCDCGARAPQIDRVLAAKASVAKALVKAVKKRDGTKFVAALKPGDAVAVIGSTVVVANPDRSPEVRKGGRPVKIEGKPWEAEGISRRTWYNRQSKLKPSEGGK